MEMANKVVVKKMSLCSKISIVIPMYNVEKYIGDCLESIARQGSESLEVISYKDLQHKRLEYYLLKYKSLMKEKKYAKAFCSIVCAFPYSFFDKKLRLYKVVIKSILVELKK